MNTPSHTRLDDCIDAARTHVDADRLEAATTRFRASLPAPRPVRETGPRWLRLAGATALVALALVLLPSLLPDRFAGGTLAQAQQWFTSYRTMHLVMETRQGGQELSRLEVWTNDSGATRIELGPMLQVLIPGEEMRTRLPGGEVISVPLPETNDVLVASAQLAWLDDLRTFRGQAEPLERPRTIGDIRARGWALELAAGRHVLWVDPADQRPLLLEASLPGGLTMESRFVFDAPLSPELFRLPDPALPASGER